MGTGGLLLRRLRARVADQPTGFVWIEKGKLAGSGWPASRSQVEWLVRAGVRSILGLTEEPLPKQWIEAFGLVYGHVPMRDHEPPSFDSLEKGVEFIRVQVGAGRPVAVHCLAGEGRTGCVLAAFLIKERGMSPDQALGALRELKPAFVEWPQEKAVLSYAQTAKP
ncbi:MAG: dual specificity protein phosphatase family protein [Thaumarchaeota archaeon]|nr:dual specificity protein phosphatase family protein [Nitrososphaerota archaeon]